MSILINMEMPKNCLECVFYRRTDPVYDYCCISSVTPKGYVPNDCPLIEVPEHGRLIDADATVQVFDNSYGGNTIKTTISRFILAHIVGEIPPTVIPADKDGET